MEADSLRQHLATNIRNRRAQLEISQEQLAARAGLHRTYVGAIERGERNVTLLTVERLAKALESDPIDLIRAHSPEVLG